jgi:hypothetical protein
MKMNMQASFKALRENPETNRIGSSWTAEEDAQLLQELNTTVEIDEIARNHRRTPGAIRTRCHVIAYRMHCDNIDINIIKLQTRLCERVIHEIIAKKEGMTNKPAVNPSTTKEVKTKKTASKPSTEPVNILQTDILEMKKDIAELKESVKEIVDMLKAIYDFEESE